jgi:hypothetical protein
MEVPPLIEAAGRPRSRLLSLFYAVVFFAAMGLAAITLKLWLSNRQPTPNKQNKI